VGGKMFYKLITTIQNNIIYCALICDKNKLIEIHPISDNIINNDNNISNSFKKSYVGNIYIGKVVRVVKGINAAFVDIGLEQNAYLSLNDVSNIYYTNGKDKKAKLVQGDEIIVQVTKDAHKTKGPKLTTDFSITGRFSVLTTNKCFLGISSKIIDKKERKRLKDIFIKNINSEYGFIARTNASEISNDEINNEINELISTYNKIVSSSSYRTVKQCIYNQPHKYITLLRDLFSQDINEYVYDNEILFNEAKLYIENYMPEQLHKVRLYTDKSYNLYNLYGLASKVNKALNEKIWLKSGASIVIQPTEALVSIDVNTEKFQGKKNIEETIFKTNVEAAHEIARQIRLRNLSGIIIIDFIDMKDNDNKLKLMDEIKELLSKDRIKTNLIDMTPLGLVEITRKKTDRTLHEKMKFLKED
jgi:ribonuclease G